MRKTLLLAVLAPLMFACSEDDAVAIANQAPAETINSSPPEEDQEPSALNGTWNMDSYYSFNTGDPGLQPGNVVWTFAGNTLTVVNNIEENYPFLLPSGTYELSFTITDELQMVTIDGFNYGFSLEGGELAIKSEFAAVDGLIMYFSAN